ncbi:EAL domain-containing protein, partial [Schwartzia sp. (in: firmicutes)]
MKGYNAMENENKAPRLFGEKCDDYLSVLTQIDIPLAIYQFVDNKVVTIFVSDAILEYMGHGIKNREDMIDFYNEDMYRYVHPDDRDRIIKAARDFAMGRSSVYDVTYREQMPVRKGWSVIHARGYHHTMTDGTRYAIVYYDDVTTANEMDRAQEDLMNRTFFESLARYDEAVVIFDVETHELFYANERMRKIIAPPPGYGNGVSIEEYLGIDAFPYSAAEMIERGKFTLMLPDENKAVIFHASRTEWQGREACVLMLADREDRQLIDELTALPSLNYLRVHGEKELCSLMPGPKKFSVLFFDICDFKEYNYLFGYDAGDTLLRQCADVIREHFKGEFVCRFYDDHFVVLSTKDNLEDEVASVCRDILGSDFGPTIQLKVGIYEMKDRDEGIIAACEKAQLARKWIQFDSSKFCCFYEPAMQEMDTLQHYVASHVDEAIDNGWIEVYYQPVACTLSKRVYSFEALARWNDPEYGLLHPGVFIGALESSHQIHKLDSYMILHVCREMREAMDEGKTVVPVSFNLSRLDFVSCDIFQIIEDAVKAENIDRSMLHIEITESLFAANTYIKEQVVRFHQAGYEVWMDDFGSGYSSLNVLKDYDFDALKIDMVFLSKFDQRSKDIIRAIVSMAKEIGIHTLAEGVETQEQMDFLRDIGCQFVQGYLIGRPQPIRETIALLNERQMPLMNAEERVFCRALGTVDFQTDRSMALILFDGTTQTFLFANDAFKQSLAEIGVVSLREAEAMMNDQHTPAGRMYHSFAVRTAASGAQEEFTYAVDGKYMQFTSKAISRLDEKYMIIVSLETMTVHADTKKIARFNRYLMAMAMSYDEVSLIHFDEDYVERIISNGAFCEGESDRHNNLLESRNLYASMFIHPDDLEAYLAFSEPSTLISRIEEAEAGYLSEEF